MTPKGNHKRPSKRGRGSYTWRRGQCDCDQSVAATSQGMSVATGRSKRQGTESPLEPLEGG